MWKRILAPAMLVSLLWVAGNTATSYFTKLVHESHTRGLVENVTTIRAAWAMQDSLWRLHAIVMEAQTKSPHETRVVISELEAAFDRQFQDVVDSSYTEKEKVLDGIVRDRFSLYRDDIDARLKRTDANGKFVADAEDNEKTMRLARAVAEPCRELVEVNEQLLADTTHRAGQLSSLADLLWISFLVAGPVVGLILAFWLVKNLTRSISKISVTLNDAAGNLAHEVGSVEVRGTGGFAGLQEQAELVANQVQRVWEKLQEDRQRTLAMARLAAVGELAAGIVHELRNPLTSVKLIFQTAIPGEAGYSLDAKAYHIVEGEIGRLERTIQGLLDFARPPVLRRVRHDLRVTVRRAVNLIEGRANQQGISISTSLPDRPIFVNGDPEQLHQVLVNLLINGVEAVQHGGKLSVAAKAADGTCSIFVSDSGPGIREEILPKIFEPFVTSKERGTGLGLAVSLRIVAEHGGLLLATNRPEGGATFTLKLPVEPDNAVGPSASTESVNPSSETLDSAMHSKMEEGNAYRTGH
ncbi:MAG: ATP-binding protein [Thermoguttaceae bacterium]|jgi:signal transduction histidine kinase